LAIPRTISVAGEVLCRSAMQCRRRREKLQMITVRDTPTGATLSVKVHPRAKKNAIVGEVGEALKVALTAPPIEGRANEACVAFFAELLNVPRSSVTIAAGQSSRNKVIRVAGVTAAWVEERLRSAVDAD